MTTQLEKRLFTVQDYYKMAEVGIIKPSDRVELLNGEVIKMSPIRSPHASMVDLLNEILTTTLHKKAIIRVQNPIRIGKYSEPEPDFSIVKIQPDRYRDRHPQPGDVLLVIEVADSSLEKDRTVKKELYAKARISEYWIVNLTERQIEVFSQPEEGNYHSVKVFKEGTISCSTIEFELSLSELFI
jgi:Uma2 family endonuclease